MKHIPNGITRFNQVQRLDNYLRKMYDIVDSICRDLDITIEEADYLDQNLRDGVRAVKSDSRYFIYEYVLDSRVRQQQCLFALSSLISNLHWLNEDIIAHNKYIGWFDGHEWGKLYRQVKFDLEQMMEGLKDKNE